MNRTDHLDLTISYLKVLNVDNKLVNATEFPTKKDFDIPDIEDALDKLVDLGYAGKNQESFGYYLNFDGRLFYENTPRCFKGKPFRYQSLITKSKVLWTITKTFGVIINGIALITIGIWTAVVSDRTNVLQSQIDHQQEIINTQNKQLGSLADSLAKEKNHYHKLDSISKRQHRRKKK